MVGKLEQFVTSDMYCVITVKVDVVWMKQKFWLFKTLVKALLSLRTKDAAQQFIVGSEGNITFLIHKDAFELHGNRPNSGAETCGGPFGTVISIDYTESS